MPGTPQADATHVPVFSTRTGAGGAYCRRLGDLLVDNAIYFLLIKEMVVTMEEGSDVIVNEQLMNRNPPPRALLVKSPAPVRVFTAPLVRGCKLCTPPAL